MASTAARLSFQRYRQIGVVGKLPAGHRVAVKIVWAPRHAGRVRTRLGLLFALTATRADLVLRASRLGLDMSLDRLVRRASALLPDESISAQAQSPDQARTTTTRPTTLSGMNEPGIPIPEPYDDPANWPFKWCSYEEARGFVTRVRAEGSKEAHGIAAECGVHVQSIRRAMVWYLLSTGQYAPQEWFAYQRQRKAESRRKFLERMAERDRVQYRAQAKQRNARAQLAQERALHIASSYSEAEERTQRRRELQRRLNAKNRANL